MEKGKQRTSWSHSSTKDQTISIAFEPPTRTTVSYPQKTFAGKSVGHKRCNYPSLCFLDSKFSLRVLVVLFFVYFCFFFVFSFFQPRLALFAQIGENTKGRSWLHRIFGVCSLSWRVYVKRGREKRMGTRHTMNRVALIRGVQSVPQKKYLLQLDHL